MRRGEEKELVGAGRRELFRPETDEFQNGKSPDAVAHAQAFRQAVGEIGLIFLLWALLLCILCAAGCGGGSAATSPPPPPPPAPPPSVTVKVTPSSASLLLGNTTGFTANVSGASNTAVNWAVNGISGGNAVMGTISSSGSYQAPAILPSPASMQILATSQADAASSASASVTVTSDVRVQIAPAMASVNLGATQPFAATITSAGHPATSVTWSLAGPGCAGTACGTLSADGAFTAPAIVPAPPSVTVTATSVADPAQSASAAVEIVSTHMLAVSPANATVALEQTQAFTATLDGTATQAVTWSVNGVAGGNTTLGTISNSPSQNGVYLAPVNMPAGNAVTITATSTAYPTLAASVTAQLTSSIVVSLSPTAAVRIPGARQSFTVSVAHTSNPQVAWTVNGAPNGNATVGQICISGSDPCTPPPLATAPGSVDYLAPAAVPSPAQVTVEAASVADPSRFAAASVTITPQISVTISPPSLTLPPQQVQTVTATVVGVPDQNVTWDVNGSTNGSIADGLICLPASSPCHAPNGPSAGPVEYRAPNVPPSPNAVNVRATSEASPGAQGVAVFTISTAPYITGIVPASVFAGAETAFGLRVEGVQFAAGAPGAGSTILINGTARTTNCPSAAECDTTLAPADVASAGSLTVSIQAPGASPATNNAVSLIVVAPQSTQSVIALDASAPIAAGMDITVVEPVLAGSDPPEQLSLLEIGLVDPATGTCTLAAPPLVLVRPASGSTVISLCVFGTALDQGAQVALSSPAPPDLTAANLNSSGSVLLEFDVTVPAAAAAGARSMFIATANQDQAVLTAAVEVQ